MTVTQGTIPYPQSADPAPLQQAATTYLDLAGRLSTAAGQITSAVTTAKGGWTGSAADAWASHVTNRAQFMTSLASTIAQIPPVLSAMATSITTTSASYSAAVAAEQTARSGLPYTAAALATALAEETAADVALQAAGVACAAELAGPAASLVEDLASLALGELHSEISEVVPQLINDLVSDLNTVLQVPLPGGSTLRVNPIGVAVASTTPLLALEGAIGATARALEAKLNLTADDGSLLSSLTAQGLVTQPSTVADMEHNQALLEATRRSTDDKSAVLLNTVGTNPDGTTNLSVTIPGINPAGPLIDGSGGRSGLDAGGDQLTKWGREEQGVYDNVMAQGVQPGDTVNLYGHSQGGIVAQNVANQLAAEGFKVNVITDGSPETQLNPSINAQLFQDQGDIVPFTRNFGLSGAGVVESPNQQVITTDTGLDPVTAHMPDSYGSWATANPSNPGVQAANSQLSSQIGSLSNVTSNIAILTGPGSPADAAGGVTGGVTGAPVSVPTPPSPNLTP